MSKRSTCFTFLIVLLALSGVAYGRFDPFKDPALVGWWSFDEGTGTTAADSSPFGRAGTLTGGATWTTGRFGGGIQLDGTSGYVKVPSFPLTTDSITMVVWLNGWKAANWAALVTGHPARLELCFGDNNTLHYTWNNDAANTWSWTGGPVIPQDTWAMLAVTVDPTKAIGYVYTDDAGLSSSTNSIAHVSQTFSVLQMGWSFGDRYVRGIMDEVAVFSRALTQEEIQVLAQGPRDPALASAPGPEDEATDVPRDMALSWEPGETAASHHIYIGTSFDDVNDAAEPTASQTAATYDPEGLLEFEQTYYWRVDEVAADGTVFKGIVWSFTVEPFAYPITNLTVQASAQQPTSPATRTIDRSGLDEFDQHGVDLKTMWTTGGGLPAWIQYTFDKEYKLHELWVWNANSELELLMGFGAKDVVVEHSTDGENWTTLENVPQFAQGTGQPTYTANTVVDLGEVIAKHVKLTINDNWGTMPMVSLSEVRFFYTPVQAFEPTPADNATEVALDTTFNWRPGREATSHEVYFGTDANAVAEGTVAAKTVIDHRYTPDSMNFGTPYYWRVDEAGDAGTYKGDVWSFTSQEFALAEDFESYTDDIDAEETIWQTWTDGVANDDSGSQVGYDDSPFAEQTIVHSGKQSMPMLYDNDGTFREGTPYERTGVPFYSEAERGFSPTQNWTGNGASEVGLWVRGNPAKFVETAPGQYTISSKSADIWGTADNFRFVYKRLTGNGSITAKVLSVTGGSATWSKAGVMIRGSLDPASSYALMHPTPDGRRSFQNRPTDGGNALSAHSATGAITFPVWVKVERQGNQITAYYSQDGKTWTKQPDTENTGADKSPNPQTINMTDPVYIGLAVAGNNSASDFCFGEFSDVAATGNVTGDWTVASIGANPGNDVATMYVTVEDSAGKKGTASNADIVTSADWTRWAIPMSDFAGVNFSKVSKIIITIGDKAATTPGGSGMVFVDDIGFGSSAGQ